MDKEKNDIDNQNEILPDKEEELKEDDQEVVEKINTNLKRNKEMNEALKKVLRELNKDNEEFSQ